MIPTFFVKGWCLLLSFGLTACVAVPSSPPQAVSTPTAPTSSITTQPSKMAQTSVKRVVALTSLSADIIQHLDQTKLVGVSGSRLLLQNPAFANIPRVSEGQTPPNLEKILALEPDLVIGASGFHDQVLGKLKQLNIPTFTTEVQSWRSLQELTKTLATAIAVDPTPLLQRYQTFLPEQTRSSPSTLVLVSQQPILAPNKTSWAGDLLKQFNLQNLAADLQTQSQQRGYVTLSPERILRANPEALILVNTEPGVIERLKAQPFWNQLRATQQQRIYVFDYYGLVNPGSINKIEQACQQLLHISSQPLSQL